MDAKDTATSEAIILGDILTYNGFVSYALVASFDLN